MHIIRWEFVVPADARDKFQQAYGPDGDWVRFRRAEGYLGTQLLHSQDKPDTFLTVDRWETIPTSSVSKTTSHTSTAN